MSELRYQKVWLGLGLGHVCLVVYLSVADLALPQVDFSVGDKVNHLLAYGFLMGWFGQIVKVGQGRWLLMVALCGLGVGMEVVQSALPHRWFDLLDAAANTAGIVVAAVALCCGADNILAWVEKKVISNFGR